MQTELYGINVGEGLDVKERYLGPAAWWIASRLSHPVRFERDWFWTTATCHAGDTEDRLAFRQRPDGNGIEARCLDGSCSPEMAADGLGVEAGWFVRGPTAYEPLAGPVHENWRLRDLPWWRIAWYGAAALLLTASLALGHGPEAAVLNLIGFCVASLLTARCLMPRRKRRHRR